MFFSGIAGEEKEKISSTFRCYTNSRTPIIAQMLNPRACGWVPPALSISISCVRHFLIINHTGNYTMKRTLLSAVAVVVIITTSNLLTLHIHRLLLIYLPPCGSASQPGSSLRKRLAGWPMRILKLHKAL